MKTPLQIIADYGCPTDSYIAATQFFGEREDLTLDQYRTGIRDIIGMIELPETESYHFAKVLFLYCVQETLRVYQAGVIPDMADVYVAAVQRTNDFLQVNPWASTRFNISHGLSDVEDLDPETGVVVPQKPKGAKKEVTERIFKELKSNGATRQDIIDAFVAETGMSKAGATTYFHALKKEFGFVETDSGEKKQAKPESKQELAERIYQNAETKDKATIMSLFIDQLGTSKLGAQTYYYACKKKFLTQAQQ